MLMILLYAFGNSVDVVQRTLQSCIDHVYNWCINNRLYMNMKKNRTMWFVNSYHTNDEDTNYSISINGVPLSRVYN